MPNPLAGVRAVLVDLEGTVYQAGRLIPGAVEVLHKLASQGVSHCFTTNTTSRPRSTIVRELAGMGLEVEPDHIFSAPRAGRDYLLGRGLHRCHLLVKPAVFGEFAGIARDDARPQAVVLGDLGSDFTFECLNRAFRFLLDGAELVTLVRNRYYRAEDGLILDAGPFAAALEYASRREATLVGKPSPTFYLAALKFLGIPPSAAAVVGDDIESDVAGGQAAGMRGVLVRTGKFRPQDLEGSTVKPDAVIQSLADLPRVL